MSTDSGISIAEQLRRLAADAVEVQRMLDAHNARRLGARGRGRDDGHPGSTVDRLIPPVTGVALSRYTIELNLVSRNSTASSLQAGPRIMGRGLNAMVELKLGRSESLRDRLSLTVEHLPPLPKRQET